MKNKRKRRIDGSVDTAYKIVLYPTDEQKNLIARTLGCCRYVYNQALNERTRAYANEKRTISYNEQAKELPFLKKQESTIWLKEVDSTALQHALRNLQQGYDNFFLGIKEHRHVGFPKYKSKRAYEDSYYSANNSDSIQIVDDNHIKLPKLGTVKCKMPRKPDGRILNATVTRTSYGKYTASIMCESPAKEKYESTGSIVGVDLGIKSLAVTSEGQIFDNPKSYEANQKSLIRQQRSMSRKKAGSNNREKQRKRLAKIHKKIKNQRIDAIHKMTTSLVRNHDVICIEDLSVKEMKEHNRRLAKAISDASFGEIRRQLEYKCKWYGRELRVVDRYYPSSQRCSQCGHVNPKTKDLRVRYWVCPECGKVHDRDINAAINIRDAGMRIES